MSTLDTLQVALSFLALAIGLGIALELAITAERRR